MMKAKSVLATAGLSLTYYVAIAANYGVFLVACEVGLTLSARPLALAGVELWAVGAVFLVSTIATALLYVVLVWRARVGLSGGGRVAIAMGLFGVVGFAFLSATYGLLLTSATWGSHAGSNFFERNRLVEAAAPAWIWWLLILASAFAAITGALLAGPSPATADRRRYGWYAYLALAAVPTSSIGALVTTSMISL